MVADGGGACVFQCAPCGSYWRQAVQKGGEFVVKRGVVGEAVDGAACGQGAVRQVVLFGGVVGDADDGRRLRVLPAFQHGGNGGERGFVSDEQGVAVAEVVGAFAVVVDAVDDVAVCQVLRPAATSAVAVQVDVDERAAVRFGPAHGVVAFVFVHVGKYFLAAPGREVFHDEQKEAVQPLDGARDAHVAV